MLHQAEMGEQHPLCKPYGNYKKCEYTFPSNPDAKSYALLIAIRLGDYRATSAQIRKPEL